MQTALEKAYLRWDRIELGDPFAYVRQAVVNQHLSWVRRRLWRERPSGARGRAATSSFLDGRTAWPTESGASRSPGGDRGRAGDAEPTRAGRRGTAVRRGPDRGETAAALGVAVGTVKSANARALEKLRAAPELSGVTR